MRRRPEQRAASRAAVAAAVLLRHACAGSCHPWAPSQKFMRCDAEVPLCGVLTLETGHGDGVYGRGAPAVHGLWPQVGRYGNSSCRAPKGGTGAEAFSTASCYREGGYAFQQKEWRRHGICAGVHDERDFLEQVCELARGPLEEMRGAGDAASSAEKLHRAGYCVWSLAAHDQVELSACAGEDGRWQLADVSEFRRICGASTTAGPSMTAGPSATAGPNSVRWAAAVLALGLAAAACTPGLRRAGLLRKGGVSRDDGRRAALIEMTPASTAA